MTLLIRRVRICLARLLLATARRLDPTLDTRPRRIAEVTADELVAVQDAINATVRRREAAEGGYYIGEQPAVTQLGDSLSWQSTITWPSTTRQLDDELSRQSTVVPHDEPDGTLTEIEGSGP